MKLERIQDLLAIMKENYEPHDFIVPVGQGKPVNLHWLIEGMAGEIAMLRNLKIAALDFIMDYPLASDIEEDAEEFYVKFPKEKLKELRRQVIRHDKTLNAGTKKHGK